MILMLLMLLMLLMNRFYASDNHLFTSMALTIRSLLNS